MIELDEETRRVLTIMRKEERDARKYKKISVILTLDRGYSVSEVSILFDLDESTIYRYIDNFKSNTPQNFLHFAWTPFSGKLTIEEKAVLKAEVKNGFYSTALQIIEWTESYCGVRLSKNCMTTLLGKLGFSYKKTKLVPAKADPERQQLHIEGFEVLMTEKSENTLVFFNDGVHPQHNTRSEYAWIPKGQEYEMPSNPGRNRLNISGAINAENPTEVIIVEGEMVNSQSTILVWEKIEKAHPEKQIIHFCDNAAYYKSGVIADWLTLHPNTTVRFLPPYSPNLNPIERLWKFMKKKAINSFYYETLAEFRKAIFDFFSELPAMEIELRSLITLNFRVVGTQL